MKDLEHVEKTTGYKYGGNMYASIEEAVKAEIADKLWEEQASLFDGYFSKNQINKIASRLDLLIPYISFYQTEVAQAQAGSAPVMSRVEAAPIHDPEVVRNTFIW